METSAWNESETERAGSAARGCLHEPDSVSIAKFRFHPPAMRREHTIHRNRRNPSKGRELITALFEARLGLLDDIAHCRRSVQLKRPKT